MSKENDDISNADLSLRKILSQNIRIFRKNLHLTQERLAENADISLPYLSDIEHCKTGRSCKGDNICGCRVFTEKRCFEMNVRRWN